MRTLMLPRGSKPSSWLMSSSMVRCTSLELPSPSLNRVPGGGEGEGYIGGGASACICIVVVDQDGTGGKEMGGEGRGGEEQRLD